MEQHLISTKIKQLEARFTGQAPSQDASKKSDSRNQDPPFQPTQNGTSSKPHPESLKENAAEVPQRMFIDLESSEKLPDLIQISGATDQDRKNTDFGNLQHRKRNMNQLNFRQENNLDIKKMKVMNQSNHKDIKMVLADEEEVKGSDKSDSFEAPTILDHYVPEKNKKITDFFNYTTIKRKSSEATQSTAHTTTQKPASFSSKSVSDKKTGRTDELKQFGATKTKLNQKSDDVIVSKTVEDLNMEIEVLQGKVKEKDATLQILNDQIRNDQQSSRIHNAKMQALISRKLIEVEQLRRERLRSNLVQQKQRLGEYVTFRDGTKFVDSWNDGAEIKSIKERLAIIQQEKTEMEKRKRALKNKKATSAGGKTGMISMDTNTMTLDKIGKSSNLNPHISNNFYVQNTGVDVGSVEVVGNSLESIKDAKDRINSRMQLLSREESLLKDQLERLEQEKSIFIQEYKRLHEEDQESKDSTISPWPILSNRYQLLALLGKGGFSEVYKSFDLEELREVACKIHQINLNWSENTKQNYIKHALRENNVQTELAHPNIVKLYDTVEIDQNSFCTVLEFCEGPDLAQYLRRYKTIPEKEAKTIVRQVLAGLKYLNEFKTKIIHYDLKPQNILFHKGEVKISDFGLCKILEGDESRCELTSQGVGTYWYLPPETFAVSDKAPVISSKVDVWAVGVIFFELLYGQKPFGHNMAQEKILKEKIILKSVTVNFPQRNGISNEAKEFIKNCLAYHESERYDIQQAYNAPYFTKK